jgi:hypothetical protein
MEKCFPGCPFFLASLKECQGTFYIHSNIFFLSSSIDKPCKMNDKIGVLQGESIRFHIVNICFDPFYQRIAVELLIMAARESKNPVASPR